MQRDLGVRSKILVALLLPVLVLLTTSAVTAAGAVSQARRAAQVEAFAARAAGLPDLVRSLQAERTLTDAVLAGDPAGRPRLDEARAAVTAALAGARSATAAIDAAALDESLGHGVARPHDGTVAARAELDGMRAQVDAAATTAPAARQAFDDVIAAHLAVPAAVGDAVDDRRLAAALRALVATQELAEALAHERDDVSAAIAAGPSGAAASVAEPLSVRTEAVRVRTTVQTAAAGVLTPAAGDPLVEQRAALVPGTAKPEAFRAAVDGDLAALSAAAESLGSSAVERAGELAGQASLHAVQVILGALLLVALTVAGALLLDRSVVRPLRRLAASAERDRDELPAGSVEAGSVEAGSVEPGSVEPGSVESGPLADPFVTRVRRDLPLLSRQLGLLDRLARAEQDPTRRDDLASAHRLAARMRRNAESLLVLAGIDSGRRPRRPVPLPDVVRVAAAEVEDSRRIDVVALPDHPVVAHAAVPVAHLLAELLENATSFSDPSSRVVVSSAGGSRGLSVTVTDDGSGLGPDEIARANLLVSDPPADGLVGAERLGLRVVGRLARRLDVRVTLRAGAERGTVAEVELPHALFAAGFSAGAAAAVGPVPAARTGGTPTVEPELVTVAGAAAPAGPSGPPATGRRGDGAAAHHAPAHHAQGRPSARHVGTELAAPAADGPSSAAASTPSPVEPAAGQGAGAGSGAGTGSGAASRAVDILPGTARRARRALVGSRRSTRDREVTPAVAATESPGAGAGTASAGASITASSAPAESAPAASSPAASTPGTTSTAGAGRAPAAPPTGARPSGPRGVPQHASTPPSAGTPAGAPGPDARRTALTRAVPQAAPPLVRPARTQRDVPGRPAAAPGHPQADIEPTPGRAGTAGRAGAAPPLAMPRASSPVLPTPALSVPLADGSSSTASPAGAGHGPATAGTSAGSARPGLVPATGSPATPATTPATRPATAGPTVTTGPRATWARSGPAAAEAPAAHDAPSPPSAGATSIDARGAARTRSGAPEADAPVEVPTTTRPLPAPPSGRPVADTGGVPADVRSQRSAVASHALSELSRLSTHRTDGGEATGPRPQRSPDAGTAPPRPTAGRRERSADVRSMLAGHRADVEPDDPQPTPGVDPAANPSEPPSA